MELANFGGQRLIDLGRQRVGTLGFARHEKEIAVATLLVKVELYVGFPLME